MLCKFTIVYDNLGAIHTSELDRSEIDLNECERFLKANWDRSQIDQLRSVLVWMAPKTIVNLHIAWLVLYKRIYSIKLRSN